jgi:membrane fusion protein, multidrug efflux system
MKRLLAIVTGLAALAAVGALVVPAFAASSKPVKSAKPAATTQVQQLTLYVFRGKEAIPGAADGKGHDTMVPSTFAIKAGVPVKVTVYNYDEGAHTITAPSLGLNALIKPGTAFTTAPANATPTELLNQVIPGVTHFTFTAKKAGVYRWHCALPCDAGQAGWAMTADPTGPSKNGFMAGYIVVVA